MVVYLEQQPLYHLSPIALMTKRTDDQRYRQSELQSSFATKKVLKEISQLLELELLPVKETGGLLVCVSVASLRSSKLLNRHDSPLQCCFSQVQRRFITILKDGTTTLKRETAPKKMHSPPPSPTYFTQVPLEASSGRCICQQTNKHNSRVALHS